MASVNQTRRFDPNPKKPEKGRTKKDEGEAQERNRKDAITFSEVSRSISQTCL